MSEEDRDRLQALVTATLQRRIEESLALVEQAVARWRSGGGDLLGAHAEALRHSARASVLSTRVSRATSEGADLLLRDGVEAGVLTAEEFEQLTGKPIEDVPPPPPLDDEVAREAGGPLPEKRAAVGKLLEDGPILIHLDARRAGVRVPAGFAGDPRLVLRLGYQLTPRIPDLELAQSQLIATLTFRGTPFRCMVPWSALYAVVSEDGRGLVWPDDVPPEAAADFLRSGGEVATPASASTSPPPEGGPEPKNRPRRGSHLKLV